jgi:heme/copper-type cytochrome/quinol oxidase subunit 3
MSSTLVMPRPLHPRPVEPLAPPVSNTRLAMIVVIAAESMLFAGLIGTFLVFRLSARVWPPTALPRLPLGVTTLNTIVLLGSVVPMRAALRAVRRDDLAALRKGLGWSALLGAAFLAIQGGEWVRLVGHGLTAGGSLYGATFYLLIGSHGVHVLTAVVWLLATLALASAGRFTPARHAALEMCALYWYFVCALWAVLFPLVYLY